MAEHSISHQELESTLPITSLNQWTKDLKIWETDPSQPNPFEITQACAMLAAIWHQLADDEAKDLAVGWCYVDHEFKLK